MFFIIIMMDINTDSTSYITKLLFFLLFLCYAHTVLCLATIKSFLALKVRNNCSREICSISKARSCVDDHFHLKE